MCRNRQKIIAMIGLNLRSLLEGEFRTFNRASDPLLEYSDSEIRDLISKIEDRIRVFSWLELSDGTTYDKTFIPGKFKAKTFKERLLKMVELEESSANHRDVERHSWMIHFKKMINSLPDHGEL